jgi:asparagine synthase (glutamine-hydrolysing)
MRNQLLRDADWAGMAHSLEIRVPLVDVALLRALVPMLNSDAPPTKHDMALTPRTKLPVSVLDRRKTGFQIPVRKWLQDAERKAPNAKRRANERGLRGWAREVYARYNQAAAAFLLSAFSFQFFPS